MSTGYERVSEEPPPNSLPLAWQRLLALSGVVFAVLFVIGWFASGGDAPDYGASDQAWTNEKAPLPGPFSVERTGIEPVTSGLQSRAS